MNFDVVNYLDTLIGSPKSEEMAFEDAADHFDRLGYRYELEERCAILEYDGGLDRDAAEKQAVTEMFKRGYPNV